MSVKSSETAALLARSEIVAYGASKIDKQVPLEVAIKSKMNSTLGNAITLYKVSLSSFSEDVKQKLQSLFDTPIKKITCVAATVVTVTFCVVCPGVTAAVKFIFPASISRPFEYGITSGLCSGALIGVGAGGLTNLCMKVPEKQEMARN
ncbi:hypothetical protein D5018_16970 [Parashewanella curva]|uniref:Uncharacterized protein n=1 Tax=Parashewanella curva TaxID=2338552 RepID=A0A3L8PSV5_9GAMM|nr:hypothetical protein [Parashewanella curva]RLV58507.1 hypothetical protein D5018_16970 [Parashewanella curva]